MSDKPEGFFEGTEMPNAGWWEALWPDPASVLTKIGIKPDMDVIDLCSGDGWFTLQIARLARHVVAIDIEPALLDLARTRLRENRITNCDFVAGDAYDIGRLWPRPVDFVFWRTPFTAFPTSRGLYGRCAWRSSLAGASRSSVGTNGRSRKQKCWASHAARERSCACRRTTLSMPRPSTSSRFVR